MDLHIDVPWILQVAEIAGAHDPAPDDYGIPVAAVAAHKAELLDRPVYDGPYARAAALVHILGWAGQHLPRLHQPGNGQRLQPQRPRHPGNLDPHPGSPRHPPTQLANHPHPLTTHHWAIPLTPTHIDFQRWSTSRASAHPLKPPVRCR
jgi:hypothetical protein